MITEAKKTNSRAVRVKKTSLNDFDLERYNAMSQDEIDKVFYDHGYMTYQDDDLANILSSKQIQDIIDSDLLYGLDKDERYELMSHFVIDISMKAQERELGVIQYNTPSLENPKVCEKNETMVYAVDIADAIDVVFANKKAKNLLTKIIAAKGHEDKLKENSKPIREEIAVLIRKMESEYKGSQTWKVTYKDYGVDVSGHDKHKKLVRLEVYSRITEDVLIAHHYNNYPLLRKELPKQHIEGEDVSMHISKNGITQNQKCLDALNVLQHNIWKVSKYIHIGRYQQVLLEEYMSKKDDFKRASFLSQMRVQFLPTRFRLGADRQLFMNEYFDSRGRIYLKTYQLNPQGSKYEKQMLVPHEDNFKGCELTENNYDLIRDNIYIAIANAADKDKLPFAERTEIGKKFYESKSKPAVHNPMFPLVMHYIEMLDNMKKEIYPATMMGLDATNQGLQLYSVLTGCKTVGETCNTANGSVRADAYKMLADAMNNALDSTCFDRDNCKKSLMTTMYGSSKGVYEILEKLYPSLDENDAQKQICNDLGLSLDLSRKGEPIGWLKVKRVFNESLEEIAPRAMTTMRSILDISNELNQAEYTWTLPDGFRSHYRVKQEEEYEISVQQTRNGSTYISIPFKEDVYKQNADSKGLPANIVQSIDGYVAREMIRRMDGKFITTIHDAFYCHPEHMELMRQNYKDILCEILQSDLLNDILSEILGHRTSHSKNNGLAIEDIQNSDFILS